MLLKLYFPTCYDLLSGKRRARFCAKDAKFSPFLPSRAPLRVPA